MRLLSVNPLPKPVGGIGLIALYNRLFAGEEEFAKRYAALLARSMMLTRDASIGPCAVLGELDKVLKT